jgi:acyl-coenzyme A thioesterase PaaI-like protein
MNAITTLGGRLTGLVPGPPDLSVLGLYTKLSALPAGRALFTRGICLKAPYFGSIDPLVAELRPGYCEVHAKNRRAVHNHIGTVHAIAMCNMAELAAGKFTEVTIPRTHRWIPKGMTVEYLARAETDLRAIAELEPLPEFGEAAELAVPVDIVDAAEQTVMRAVITMWVSPKPAVSARPTA